MSTREELIEKSEKPGKEAMKLHPFYKGKIELGVKCIIRDFNDFAIWYTPGVAKPCLDIQAHPETVYEHTNKANMIAVLTDGTRVLGLGDIGPEASMPVMEGKAILFKYLGGVDAFPLALDTKDPQEFIRTALLLQPAFGGFNLEDIEKPKCFRILEELRQKARIPVWHDDQQGTATVTVAGLINALKVVGKKLDQVKVGFIGSGASNVKIAHLCFKAGIDPKKCIIADSRDTLGPYRDDIRRDTIQIEKWELCEMTNPGNIKGGIPAAMKGADVVIALSKSGPGVIEPQWVSDMAKDAILFTCANPVPEIFPWDALEAGARIVATGRSDFPNQVNNSLGFPGIFRGTLDVRALTITDEMCLAAAFELAKVAEDKGLRDDYIIPTMDEWEVFPREAVAVGMKAIEQGVARLKLTPQELMNMAETKIKHARDQVHSMMEDGFIKPVPKGLLED
ncbi:NADP-dependent malic enzyme [bacterium]|nr:NADP-dependent malic enzyme [bacterium]